MLHAKLRLLFVSTALFLSLPLPILAQHPGEEIVKFDVQASLASDRTLSITESIAYDFGARQRHGIYRVIPVRYSRSGGSYKLRIKVTDVRMDGQPAAYETSESGGRLKIKIGDTDRFVTGRHVYSIAYRTDRAVNFFPSASLGAGSGGELYWNVTGDDWEVPIQASSFTLTGPEGFEATTSSAVCYTGVFGSTEEACALSGAGNSVTVAASRPLDAGEGLTVAVRFPKGLIAEPTAAERLWQIFIDNGVLALPVLVFAFMYWLWYTRGRDPHGRGTVVPEYEPPRGLKPAEMAALHDQDVPGRAITATILDLARRGYLKIEFGENKGWLGASQTYTFVRGKEADQRVAPFESEVLEGLFNSGPRTTLAALKGSFYKRITPIKTCVFNALREAGLFGANPFRVRSLYVGGGVGAAVLGFYAAGPLWGAMAAMACAVSGVIIAAFGWFMPKKTREGAIALEEVEGFKWFLSVTEKDRLAFHNAPQLKPAQFHEFLPVAVAFGIEKKWAAQFKGLDIPPPDYASGAVLTQWSALMFVDSLGDLNRAAAASAFATPSSAGSGGSGFGGGGSGGGFGGGGGGSW